MLNIEEVENGVRSKLDAKRIKKAVVISILVFSFSLVSCKGNIDLTDSTTLETYRADCKDEENYVSMTEEYRGEKTEKGVNISYYNFNIDVEYTDNCEDDVYTVSGYDIDLKKKGSTLLFNGQVTDMALTDEENSMPRMTGATFDKIYENHLSLEAFVKERTIPIAEERGITTLSFASTDMVIDKGILNARLKENDDIKVVGLQADNTVLIGGKSFDLSFNDTEGVKALLVNGKPTEEYENLPSKTRGQELIKVIQPEGAENVYILILGAATEDIYTEMTLVNANECLICPKLKVYRNGTQTCYMYSMSKNEDDTEKTLTYDEYVFDNAEALTTETRKGLLTIGQGVCNKVDEEIKITETTFTNYHLDLTEKGENKDSKITAMLYDKEQLLRADLEYVNKIADRHSYFTITSLSNTMFAESLKLTKKNTIDGKIEGETGYTQTLEYSSEREHKGAFQINWEMGKNGQVTLEAKTASGKEISIDYGEVQSKTKAEKLANVVKAAYESTFSLIE